MRYRSFMIFLFVVFFLNLPSLAQNCLGNLEFRTISCTCGVKCRHFFAEALFPVIAWKQPAPIKPAATVAAEYCKRANAEEVSAGLNPISI